MAIQLGEPNNLTLSIVKPKRLCPSIKGANCLGKDSRDNGHNLVPEPPHRMTGFMLNINFTFYALTRQLGLIHGISEPKLPSKPYTI